MKIANPIQNTQTHMTTSSLHLFFYISILSNTKHFYKKDQITNKQKKCKESKRQKKIKEEKAILIMLK